MKKKKGLNILFVVIISLFCLNTPIVAARETAIIGTSNIRDEYQEGTYDVDGIEYTGTDAKGNEITNQVAHETNITVSYNGQEYTGYCPDLNKSLNGAYHGANGLVGSRFNCEEVFDDAAIGYILNSNLSTSAKEAALRARDGSLTVTGSQSEAIYNLINQANAYANNVGGATSGSLNFMNKRGNGQTVTYDVYASGPMANGVTFTCGAGCASVSGGIAAGASNGTVTITLTTGACNFTIYYNGVSGNNNGNAGGGLGGGQQVSSGGTRTMQCTRTGQQKIYFTINEGSSGSGGGSGSSSGDGGAGSGSGGAGYTGSFSDSIDKATGGAYYDEYCDGNVPNKKQCNDTAVSIPAYCDKNHANETITIHESDRIKSCILNGLDEKGYSYQMIDGQINPSNPYCAVYCKEEYEMTLPSAKFTESGRYFNLEPVRVHAKRKCYASNPLGDDNKQEILIDEFVKEITDLQKNLIDTFNNYQKWKAIKESADGAKTVESKTTCPTYDEHGVQNGSYESKGSVSTGDKKGYKEFTYKLEDADTGRYVITGQKDHEAYFKYGTPAGCPGKLETGDNGECDATCVANKVTSLKTSINELRESIRQKIEYMEECYKWHNELCLNPLVQFTYDEPYKDDINFALFDGGGSVQSDAATYGTDKVIDEAYSANAGDNRKDYQYAYCDIDSDVCNNSFEAALANKISTLKEKLYYRKIEVSHDAWYKNVQDFQTNIPHGTIDKLPAGSNPRPNYSYLGAVFPVALERPMGVYQWNLNFTNLGQFNDAKCRNGRLDQVLAAKGYTAGTGLEYVCVYVVDCDDCDYDCVDPTGNDCIITDEPSCPECDVYCENCIFDGDGATFFYATKTLNDWNPADRQLGANWSNEKGEKAREEIESTGENIYIDATYTYVLNANNMKEIRDYNKSTGTYTEKDLDFESLGGYDNVVGKSRFLRDQRNEGKMFTTIKRNEDWQLYQGTITKDGGSGPAWKVGS